MIKIEHLETEIPVYDITVEDNSNFYANGILVHNCQEITLPTRPARDFTQRIITEFGSPVHMTKTKKETGEIALCNLSSINLEKWSELDETSKTKLVDNLLRASDNMIENSFYPVPDGELSNKLRRPIGIGVSNYANYLALNKCGYNDERADELTHTIMEDMTYFVLKGSVELAKERGAYHYFKDSEWAKGKVPMDMYKMQDVNGYNFPLKHNWDELRKEIKEHGVRFSYHFAIAPTACQTGDGEIKTSTGDKRLYDIMESQDINHAAIELNGHQDWFNFKEPITIPTRNGDREVSKIWYNGKVPTKILTFEDGSSAEFSLNHKLLVKNDSGEIWKEIQYLDLDDEIISLNA